MSKTDLTRRAFGTFPYVVADIPVTLWSAPPATTNASGAVTITLPAGVFTTIISVHAQAIRNTADPTLACFALVRSVTTSAVVVQVFESKTTGVLLGGNVEGLEVTSTATTIHLMVVGT